MTASFSMPLEQWPGGERLIMPRLVTRDGEDYIDRDVYLVVRVESGVVHYELEETVPGVRPISEIDRELRAQSLMAIFDRKELG